MRRYFLHTTFLDFEVLIHQLKSGTLDCYICTTFHGNHLAMVHYFIDIVLDLCKEEVMLSAVDDFIL